MGTFTKEIAEMKVTLVEVEAAKHGKEFPLKAVMKEAEV